MKSLATCNHSSVECLKNENIQTSQLVLLMTTAPKYTHTKHGQATPVDQSSSTFEPWTTSPRPVMTVGPRWLGIPSGWWRSTVAMIACLQGFEPASYARQHFPSIFQHNPIFHFPTCLPNRKLGGKKHVIGFIVFLREEPMILTLQINSSLPKRNDIHSNHQYL